MKKDRQPTAEERRLWREMTRHDTKKSEAVQEEIDAPASQPRAAAKPKAPLPAAKPPSIKPLEPLTGRQAIRFLKPYGRVEATLDLHGIIKVEAYGQVKEFLTRCQARGTRHLLIITGKGRASEGVLRAHLPHWLNEPGHRRLIAGLAYASADKGGSGALHVLLKRQRKDP